MSEVCIASLESDPLGGIEKILRDEGLPTVPLGVDLTDGGFLETFGERETGVVIARFNEDDLLSIKAMQALLDKRPGIGVVFVSSSEVTSPVLTLLFNEGAFGLVIEPLDPAAVVSLVKKGLKRSDWKLLSLAENIELKRLNGRLSDRVNWLEKEGARTADLLRKMESLVHYLLTEQGFKAKAIRILIVSGSSYQKGILNENLGKIGFTLKTAGNGEEARDVIKEFKPHVVVSDLELAGVNGVELAKEVKGSADYPQLHFIILTSNAEKRDWILTPETRVDDCIIKPTDAVKLKDMVARIALGILAV